MNENSSTERPCG